MRNITPTKLCCVVCGVTEKLKKCSGCQSTYYCSEKCQHSHWSYHSVYCHAISDLEKLEKCKQYGNQTVRQTQVDDGTRRKVLKLVGDKPKFRCFLNDLESELLWDTGSMVTLVDRRWVRRYCPNEELLPVSMFMDEKLKLKAANASEIKFDGVLLLNFGLEKGKTKFAVPVLVSSQPIAEPILGYNIIEEVIMNGTSEDHKCLNSCFITSRPFQVAPLISVIQEKAANPDFLAEVKAPNDVVVPAGHRKQVRCRVKVNAGDNDQSVYFTPRVSGDDDFTFLETVSQLRRGRTNYVFVEVLNESCKEKVLQKGSLMGSVHSVSAVIPMLRSYNHSGGVHGLSGVLDEKDVNVVETDSISAAGVKVAGVDVTDDCSDDWIPDVDLSHLDEKQQEMVMSVLLEEKNVFSRSECDIGDIRDFKMQIHLEDNVPVREAYRKIPRNLYAEVRDYILMT